MSAYMHDISVLQYEYLCIEYLFCMQFLFSFNSIMNLVQWSGNSDFSLFTCIFCKSSIHRLSTKIEMIIKNNNKNSINNNNYNHNKS